MKFVSKTSIIFFLSIISLQQSTFTFFGQTNKDKIYEVYDREADPFENHNLRKTEMGIQIAQEIYKKHIQQFNLIDESNQELKF